MNTLKPWALGPFELLVHAEMHYRDGKDFDRRIAVVGFDNAIEMAIHTYLKLHPVQRQNRDYPNADVENWLRNFHTKVDFFISEISIRSLTLVCDKAEFIWYHEVRNGQYHVGGATIPQERELEGIRKAALWVFGVLYDVTNVEDLIEHHLNPPDKSMFPEQRDEDDRVIDNEFGTVQVAGDPYYTSELVYALDPILYSELANDVRNRYDTTVGMVEDKGMQS